jgi:hypothetical protein
MEELEGIVKGWREWVAEEDSWFGVLHGEMLQMNGDIKLLLSLTS